MEHLQPWVPFKPINYERISQGTKYYMRMILSMYKQVFSGEWCYSFEIEYYI